jgi:hypothetical protein
MPPVIVHDFVYVYPAEIVPVVDEGPTKTPATSSGSVQTGACVAIMNSEGHEQ